MSTGKTRKDKDRKRQKTKNELQGAGKRQKMIKLTDHGVLTLAQGLSQELNPADRARVSQTELHVADQAKDALDQNGKEIMSSEGTAGNRGTTDHDIGEYFDSVIGHCAVNVGPVSSVGVEDVIETFNQRSVQSSEVNLPRVELILSNAGKDNTVLFEAVTSDTADASTVCKSVQCKLGLELSLSAQHGGHTFSIRDGDSVESVSSDVNPSDGEGRMCWS